MVRWLSSGLASISTDRSQWSTRNLTRTVTVFFSTLKGIQYLAKWPAESLGAFLSPFDLFLSQFLSLFSLSCCNPPNTILFLSDGFTRFVWEYLKRIFQIFLKNKSRTSLTNRQSLFRGFFFEASPLSCPRPHSPFFKSLNFLYSIHHNRWQAIQPS